MTDLLIKALSSFDDVRRILESKSFELSDYEILRLMLEAQRNELFSKALLGENNPDCISDYDDIHCTPISKIARALFHVNHETETETTVVKELFNLNHNIVTK